MALFRKHILAALYVLALVATAPAYAGPFQKCEEFLVRVMAPVQKAISQVVKKKEVIPETPIENTEDYNPEGFGQISLADQFIQVRNRIHNRHHKSTANAFFYDYEVRATILKMKAILTQAKDFSNPQDKNDKQHADALAQLRAEIAQYENVQRVPYLKFHETTLLFTAFQKQGLEGIKKFQMRPQGRYGRTEYGWSYQQIRFHTSTSGFNDIQREEMSWILYRSKLLSDNRLVLIPTFEELDEDFFNKISSYPVFPAGMTEDVHIVADGQLYGPVMFMLHDFYHAYWSAKSTDYSDDAIEARVRRHEALMDALKSVKDTDLNHIVRTLFHFMTHEQLTNVFGDTVVIARSKQLASLLKLDGERLEEFQVRVYQRPYDFGEIFGDVAPEMNKILAARQWLSDFFKADTHYP